MSDTPPPAVGVLRCGASRALAALLVVATGGALVAVWLTALPLAAQAGLSVLALAALAHTLRGEAKPLWLRCTHTGGIEIWRAGDWRGTQIDTGSFVSPALIVLSVRLADGTRVRRALLPDSADADGRRQLRARLRWAGRKRRGTSGPDAG